MRFGTRHLVQAAVAILLCAVVFPMVPAKAVVPGIIDLVPTKRYCQIKFATLDSVYHVTLPVYPVI